MKRQRRFVRTWDVGPGPRPLESRRTGVVIAVRFDNADARWLCRCAEALDLSLVELIRRTTLDNLQYVDAQATRNDTLLSGLRLLIHSNSSWRNDM